MSVWNIIYTYKEGLFSGLLVTLGLCLIIWASGLLFGVLFGVLAQRQKESTGWLLKTLSFILASTPVLVLLFWLHYPLQAILGVVIIPFITAALALSLINIVGVAQIIRDVLDDFPQQYVIAGKVCGLTEREIFSKIKLPIIFRQTIPQFLTLQVSMLQLTLFASLISVQELFRVAQQINSIIYKPIEIYTALAVFFIAICLPLNLLAYWFKNKYTRNLSEN
ncbi:MAG: ABC transporter permease subunit [Candidatus Buchananbacteria bacterium]|nr:ABC transporter permease subunit [Candidatus Buchananbacteria bacterium]